MLLVIEEVGRELKVVKIKVTTLETTHQDILKASTCDDLIIKLNNDLETYRTDLIRFKREKLDKVHADYADHRVYRWLSGDSSRNNFVARPRIRKPARSTIDYTSGESASDNEVTVAHTDSQSHAIGHRTFLDRNLGLHREVVGSPLCTGLADVPDVASRGKRGGTRGRPPRMRK